MVVRQYDICENPDPKTRKSVPFFVVLQSNTLSDLRTVLVAPVVSEGSRIALNRLYPKITVKRKTYCASMPELASIDSRRLGHVVGNCEDGHTAFISAVDLLFLGY